MTGVLLIVLFVMMAAFVLYAMRLNTAVVGKFENRKWDIPATLYSRPLVLHQGAALSAKDLESWLKLLRYSHDDTSQTGRYQKMAKSIPFIHEVFIMVMPTKTQSSSSKFILIAIPSKA